MFFWIANFKSLINMEYIFATFFQIDRSSVFKEGTRLTVAISCDQLRLVAISSDRKWTNLLPRPRLGMSNCMDRSESSPFATSLRSMWLSAEISPALQPKLNMADRTGFEPATSGVTGRHSNQLNYRSVECSLNRGCTAPKLRAF